MVFTLPTTFGNFSVDSAQQRFYGETSLDVVSAVCRVNSSVVPDSQVKVSRVMSGPVLDYVSLDFTAALLPGRNEVNVELYNSLGVVIDSAAVTVFFSSTTQVATGIQPPANVTFYEYNAQAKIFWDLTELTGASFFSIYRSVDPNLAEENWKLLTTVEITNYVTTSVENQVLATETIDPSTGDIVRTQVVKPIPVFRFSALVDLDTANLTLDQFFVVSSSLRVGTEVFESRFSAPVRLRSFTVPTASTLLPVPTLRDLAAQYIDQLPSVKGAVDALGHTVDVLPESPLMSTQIGPTSMFLNRLYVLDEFRDRVDNVVTLIRLDDANNDRVSDDPNSGEKLRYATVLNLPTATIQTFIDQAFDRHAARESLTRLDAQVGTATLTLTWATSTLPANLVIDQNTAFVAPKALTGATQDLTFTSMTAITVSSLNLASFYQPSLGIYRLQIRVKSQSAGAVYNVPASSIVQFANPPAIPITVVNEDTVTDAGDRESNIDLSDRILSSRRGAQISSRFWLDQQVLNNSTIRQRHIVRAGDPYMLRDWDFLRNVAGGGMADIYVSSADSQTFSESVALNNTFSIKANLFARKAIDQGPTPATAPFFAIIQPQPEWLQFLRTPLIGALTSVYNVPRGIDYLISAPAQVEVIENRFIRLKAEVTDALAPWSDGEEVNVTFTLVANTFLLPLTRPPVLSLTDVLTEAGASVINNAELLHLSSPFLEGNSAVASDYVLLTNYPYAIPQHKDEGRQELQKNRDFYLAKKGVQIPSLVVRYLGAALTAGTDYFVTYHEATDQVSIRLSSGYSVASIFTDTAGGVEYDYNANITVAYNYDSTVRKIQDIIWQEDIIGKRNLLIKRSNDLQISFEMQAALYDLGKTSETDILIRSALSQFETSIPLSNKIYQSEIISLAEAFPNVAKVDVPLLNAHYFQSTFDYYPISMSDGGLTYVAPYWDLSLPRVDLTRDFHFWGGRPFYEMKDAGNLSKMEGTYYFFGGLNFGVQQSEDTSALVWELVPDALRCLSFLRANSEDRLAANSTVPGVDYTVGFSLTAATTVYLAVDDAACDMAGYYGPGDMDLGYLTTTTVNSPMLDGESSLGINTGARPRPSWIRNDKSWVDTGLTIKGGSSGIVVMRVFRKYFAASTVANPYHAMGGNQARSWVYGVASKVTHSGSLFTVVCSAPHGLVNTDTIVVTKTTENAGVSIGSSNVVTIVNPTTFTFPGPTASVQPYWFIDWQRNQASSADDLFSGTFIPYGLIFADDVWSHNVRSFTDAVISVVSGKIVLSTGTTPHGLVNGQAIDVTKTSLLSVLPTNALTAPYLVEVVDAFTLRLYTTTAVGTPEGVCDFRLSFRASHVAEEYRMRFNPYYDKFTHLPTLPLALVASLTVKDIPVNLEDYFVPRNQPVRLSQVVINYREETANTNVQGSV